MSRAATELTVRTLVNGETVERVVESRKLLADFLREDLNLHGAHLGCEHGVCGACTVLVDGVPARSCLMLAVQADGAEITTVESLASGDELHPLQAAFRDHHGVQCGFCTPGFLLTSLYLIEQAPEAFENETTLREALSGNLCRCTGYQGIVDAVQAAAAAAVNTVTP